MSKKALNAFNFISEKLNGLEHYEQVEVNKNLDTILQSLMKLSTIGMLVNKKKFNTNDIELLRNSIIEVLERDEDE